MKTYPRQLSAILSHRLKVFPVVAITGPRQAGKTTLAKSLLPEIGKESLYLDLELPSDLNRLSGTQSLPLFRTTKNRFSDTLVSGWISYCFIFIH